MKKKEIASQKSTKASMARAARLSSKKAKLRKGKPVKTTGKPAKKSDAAPKSNGTAVKKPKIVKKGTGEKKVVKKGASEKKASDAPKMRLKRQLTPEEKEAMKTKKGKKYWELYKEMRKQFDEDKTKFDRMEAIGKRAKQLWETVRSEHTGADERAMKAKELYRLVRGRVSKIIKARDLSRVIESLMQFGDVEIRAGLFEELKSEIPELSKSVFAHFFVLKVLRYGSKDQREYVISSFRGSVPELMNHKIASTVVEVAYNDWANATQRGLLQQEFYSPAYAQFKDSSITSLEKALEAEGADKEKILEHLREKLDPIIEKGLIQHNLIQTLLFEYLTYCSEANRKDMIDSLKEVLIHMIHTREGARVAMHCIWNTNAKDRKLIMKSWKTHVARIAKDEHGYLALIAMLDAVDDTKALDKLILRELMTDVHDVALNEIGRKVILYLVAPRDTRFTHPDVIKILSKGDDNSNSKKEMAVRHKEVTSAVAKDLLTEVCSNVKRYMAENSATLVARVIVENCGQVEGSETLLDTLHTNLASLIALPFEPTTVQPKSKIDDEKNKRGKKRKSTALLAMDTVLPEFMRDVEKEKEDRENDPELKMHVIERPATHLLIQHLLGLDAGKGSFSEKILEAVSDKDLQRWVTCNRGCFVVIKMLDTGMDKVVSKLKKRLKPCKTTFKSPNSKGAAILKKKLEF